MSESVKIIKLDIDEHDELSGVDAIALVEEPAIEADFMFFSKHQPHAFESYSDYPDAVSNNAKRGIELNEKVDNKCATQVGKVRAQQLAKGEKISVETIKRMYSYLSRAEEYYDESDTTKCGTISYLLWGGLAAKRWSESKLKELGLFEGAIDVAGLPDYNNEPSGSIIVKLFEEDDKEMVDGIVELLIKVEDIENRKQMVMDVLRDFARDGIHYDLDEFLQRVGVSMSELEFVENAGGFSVGDYVSWTYAGRQEDADRGRGQITDLRVQGKVKVPGTDFELTATEERPVALIETRGGQIVGQYVDNLRKIKKPEGFVTPSAGETEDEFISRCIPVVRGEGYDEDQSIAICYSYWRERMEINNYMEELFDFMGYIDGLPVFSTPEEAEEVAEIAGCSGYHEHPMGEFLVYMPCSEHEPEMDEVLNEAYEVWKKSKQKSWDDLDDKTQEDVLSYLESVAEEAPSKEGFNTVKSIPGGRTQKQTIDTVSFMDTPTTKTRYVYDVRPGKGPRIQGNSRDFCMELISRFTNRNKVFRKEDINQMSINGVNTGFGPGGVDQYDIFNYVGGNNCRHEWRTVTYRLENGNWVDSTMKVVSPAEKQETESSIDILTGRTITELGIGVGFSKQEFSDKQILAGPLMVPNKLIYRFDLENGEYFVYFSEETIKKIAYKFMQKKYTDNTNIEHDMSEALSDVFVVESWIVDDPMRDKSLMYSTDGQPYEKGTWFGMVKVKNKEVWDEYVKTGLVKGFSVEGFFVDELLNGKQVKE